MPDPGFEAGHAHRPASVTLIACFEGFKGLMGLAVGAGVVSLLHKDVASVVERLARQLHLHPLDEPPGVFISALSKMQDPQLVAIAVGAACYALLRLMMAYGLWRGRGWAEWLTAAGAGLYIPFEIYELTRALTWLRIAAFVGNALIVWYMLHRIRLRKAQTSPRTV